MTSLREWAIKNEVWKPKNWKEFLIELVSFYKLAWQLNQLYKFLKSDKICGKPALADIEDEKLRNKIRAAIYGGVEQNPESSFAKFMYEHFGICADKAPTFEESIDHYRNWGDGIKVSINENSWINSISIKILTEKLSDIINLCRELGIELPELELQDYYPHGPSESIDIIALLPEPGEEPKELVSLINEFKQKAVNLAIGANPFTTFTYYVRAIPVPALMGFLECDVNEIARLARFLGLKAYSMIDPPQEVQLPTKSPNKVFLIAERYRLADKVLDLQEYLERVEPASKDIFQKMIKDAINQIQFSFEPWQDYEPIFSFWLEEVLKKKEDYCYFSIEGGRILEINHGYSKLELPKKIWLCNFLIKLYPAISAGIINKLEFTSPLRLEFSSFAKEWIEKVIENEGKT